MYCGEIRQHGTLLFADDNDDEANGSQEGSLKTRKNGDLTTDHISDTKLHHFWHSRAF